MDTRSKILDAVALAARVKEWRDAGETVTVVEGTFDPLLPEHAAQVDQHSARGRVVVMIRDGAEPVLEAAVRAGLASALRGVSAVLKPGEAGPYFDGVERVSYVDQDEAAARRFVAHIHARNQAQSQG